MVARKNKGVKVDELAVGCNVFVKNRSKGKLESPWVPNFVIIRKGRTGKNFVVRSEENGKEYRVNRNDLRLHEFEWKLKSRKDRVCKYLDSDTSDSSESEDESSKNGYFLRPRKH